ncbi:mitochondrial dna replication [Fusarium sporotrichioides]|uniref:Mitochondrial dna replication n=1 Tax=Fusarium sporotrichioides TaxID=5514 RepID=A0A395RTR3_FUSSP|nr:mitochondrial dna replication [Fusarium sporotrichioides]
MDTAAITSPIIGQTQSTHKPISWSNLVVGASMNIFQVTSLGQPMEVVKTHVAANRGDSLRTAFSKTWARGGVRAFYQGLIPWAWIECSTKGSILFLASNEVEYYSKSVFGASPAVAGTFGGVAGGAAQSYLTMEITRPKNVQPGVRVPGTMEVFLDILRKEGIRGVNRGVNAVALRQISGWASRIGIARFAEGQIRTLKSKPADAKLSVWEKMAASTVGGALSCWNQPFEVLRVEMQSLASGQDISSKPTMVSAAKRILATSGPLGFFRGVVPRIGVAAWATICMVGFGDIAKEYIGDALVKLKYPHGGFLDGIHMWSPRMRSCSTRIIGSAVTVKMVEASNNKAPKLARHFADCNRPNGIMYIQQPKGLYSACWGGLMSTRAKHIGAAGIIVDGRVRDIAEHQEIQFPVFARETSILGSNTFTRASEIDVPLQFRDDLWINPGDILVGDREGVVVVPPNLMESVIGLCQERFDIDEKTFAALRNGDEMGPTLARLRK